MHLPVQMAQPQAGAAAAAAAAPARPAALGRPVILPPEFTGTSSEDWLTFMGQFNVACQANGYADDQRLDFLPCRLREGAFHVYQTFRAQHPNDAYDELCDRLTAYFNPPQHRPSFEAEFRARTMKTIESPVEFASALQKLASRAYPGQENTDLFQRLLVNQFIDGLPSPELRLHVRSASPNNLAQAVQRALEMAAIFDAEQRRSNGAAIAGASPTPAAIFAVRGSSPALPPAPSASTTGMTSASGGNRPIPLLLSGFEQGGNSAVAWDPAAHTRPTSPRLCVTSRMRSADAEHAKSTRSASLSTKMPQGLLI